MKNEFILDGKIQKDIKRFSNTISFNISSITGKFLLSDNTYRNRYTYIRVIYTGDVSEELDNAIQSNNLVRIYGRLDSEQYIAKSQKTVYNKVLRANKIKLLQFNEETKMLEEV